MRDSSQCQLFFSLSFLVLVLSLCTTIDAFALPWTTTTSQLSATQPQPTKEQLRSVFPTRNVFPQLTWLRDTAIEKIFHIPPKASKTGCDKPSLASRPSNSQLPATLLAKYGGDVVLRFNLTTPGEESALSEAADTLFLDVWEFTSNWADIRLRKEDVRICQHTMTLVN